MNRKAFSPADIMVYLLALVLGALILIYGYDAIKSLTDRGEAVMYLRFEKRLMQEIEEISSLPGTIRVPEFTLPLKFNKICFFHFNKECALSSELAGDEALICDSVNNGVANVFLFPLQEKDLKIEKIALETSPLCVEIPSGFFKLQIAGKGKSALLSMP